MSTESHKRYIEQQALREAQKAIDRGQSSLRKENCANLRVQTLEPWKRVLVAFGGVLLVTSGLFASREDIGWLALLLFALGGLTVLGAVFGIKKTVEAALNGVDVSYIFDALF
ncbi:MAG: hypothetical protein QM715_15880 [Nibricoccus sp.]